MLKSRRAVKTVNGSEKKDGSRGKRSSLSSSHSSLKPNVVAVAGKRINSAEMLRRSVETEDRKTAGASIRNVRLKSNGAMPNYGAETRSRKTAAALISSARRKSSVVTRISDVVGTISGIRISCAIDSDRVMNN